MRVLRNRAFWKAGMVVVAGLLGLAACGDDDGDRATAPGDSSTDGSVEVADASGRLAELLEGTNLAPPSEGPEAVPDRSVWVISCGESNESCADFSSAAVEAAEALGWDTNLVDGNFDPVTAGDAIRQAVADGADAVAWVAYDCAELQAPVDEALAAGLAVVGIFAMDCEEPAFVPFPYGPDGESFETFIHRYGYDRAEVVVTSSGEQVKVITSPIVVTSADTVQYEGFVERLRDCAGCEIAATVEVGFEELGVPGALEQKMGTALSQHPDAGVVVLGSDSLLFAGIQQAIASSGRAADLSVYGSEGYPSGLDLVRDGTLESVLALDARWMAWAAMDALNRHFADAEPAFGGFGWTLVTREHNLPDDGPWDSSVDYRAAFRQVWGQ